MKIGIPRSLLYYQYFPMWRTFFQALGAEVVVSPPTSKATIAAGTSRMLAETCLPVKVHCGHVLSLVGKCDYVFIPAIRSIEEGAFNCSKFLGLPDLMRAVAREAPPILEVDIDISQGKKALYTSIYGLGRNFTWNPLKVKAAADAAWEAHLAYKEEMRSRKVTPGQVLAEREGQPFSGKGQPCPSQPEDGARATVAVIGHTYILYDEYVNHRLLSRLQGLGARVVTPEMVPQEQLDRGIQELEGRPYWTYEDEVAGAGWYYLGSEVDGVISMVSFGCGPDSTMLATVRRHARNPGSRPFMALTIDEHTAEAGLVTRLEAFLDLLKRQQRKTA